jgi:hypothetical protein
LDESSLRERSKPSADVRMSASSLLPFAIQRIRAITEELERSYSDSSGLIDAIVREEIEENKQWLQKAVAMKCVWDQCQDPEDCARRGQCRNASTNSVSI